MSQKQNKLRVFIFILLVLLLLTFFGFEIRESGVFNTSTISDFIINLGPLAIVGFIALMAMAVISPLPDSIVSVTGGYLFGPFLGGFLSLVGFAFGTAFDFLLVRKLGRNYVKRRFPDSLAVIDQYANRLGWQTIIIMRVIPSVTFDLIGYAAGLSSIHFSIYLAATLIGAIPSTLFTVFLGRSIKVGSWVDAVIVLVVGITFLAVGSFVVNRMHLSQQKKQKSSKTNS